MVGGFFNGLVAKLIVVVDAVDVVLCCLGAVSCLSAFVDFLMTSFRLLISYFRADLLHDIFFFSRRVCVSRFI